MSVSRGKFLRSLGSSVTGLALGTGVATAAQVLADRLAPVEALVSTPTPSDIPFIESGPNDVPRIALTFDDGPTPGVTDLILDEFKSRGLHATFFMIGRHVVAAPDLARRVLAEGHEIGNHTFTHPKLNMLPAAQVEAELRRTQDTFAELLHHHAVWFRPPYGAFRRNQSAIAQGQGLGIVLGNVDPADWAQPGEDKIIHTILSQTKPGSIIICHDLHRQTARCVGRILDGLLERHWQPVTLSVLLERPVVN
jgi:peptidoglycan/xylan/chitin deacetylase (PgdA/CDA1 family)